MKRILDAHGLMVFLEKEAGYEKVVASFAEAVETKQKLLMCSVNFGEVFYISLREGGARKAELVEKLMQSLPIEIINADIPLAKEAARFKADRRMSYPDCFAAALAKMNGAELMTGDTEFRAVEAEVSIAWL